MSKTSAQRTPAPPAESAAAHQAFLILRIGFTVAPVLFGLDKFVGVLADWEQYLAPWIDRLVPGDAGQAMMIVGVVEIAAGIVVAVRPAIGGGGVAPWRAGGLGELLRLGHHCRHRP